MKTSRIEQLLMESAVDIVTSNTNDLWSEDITPVRISEEDERIYNAFVSALKEICPFFFESDKRRYKDDERVVAWKDLFRKKRTMSGYEMQRIVFRDPDISIKTGDVAVDLFKSQSYQVDLLAYGAKPVHIKGDSLLDVCNRALTKAVEMFQLKASKV